MGSRANAEREVALEAQPASTPAFTLIPRRQQEGGPGGDMDAIAAVADEMVTEVERDVPDARAAPVRLCTRGWCSSTDASCPGSGHSWVNE